MILAPIGIITYSRIGHLIKTVDSLRNDHLARYSKLYVFIDGPKKGDEKDVSRIRDYASSITGFSEVIVVERIVNLGIYENSLLAIKQLFKEYGKCIFLEDDNEVSPHFLQYMNDALIFYKEDKTIFGINGFNAPIRYPARFDDEFYKSKYFNSWGMGLWNDRGYLQIVNKNDQYLEVLADRQLYKKVMKVHRKLINGLKRIYKGTLHAGDFKLTFHMIKNDQFVIKPTHSFVENIGHDGSGANSIINNEFKFDKLNQSKIRFREKMIYDEKIDRKHYEFFNQRSLFLAKVTHRIRGFFK